MMKNVLLIFFVTYMLSCASLNETTDLMKSKTENFTYTFECTDEGVKVERKVTSKVHLKKTDLSSLNNTIVEKYGYDYKSCYPAT